MAQSKQVDVNLVLVAAILGGGALITYKLGLWGEAYKGTDANLGAPVTRSKVRYSDIRLKNTAELLYQEFNKVGITSGETIYNFLKDYNSEELKLIVKFFGTRCSTAGAGGVNVCIGDKKNLFQWIQSDLSQKWIDKCKALFLSTGLY